MFVARKGFIHKNRAALLEHAQVPW